VDGLTAHLLDAFSVGDGRGGSGRDAGARLTFVARGAEGRVSLLECNGLRYAVKQPFEADAGFADLTSAEEVVRREADLLGHFARAGIPVPVPVAGREGRFVVPVPERLGGGLVRLSTWVEGTAPRTGFVPGLHADALGTLLGRLHAVAPATDDPIGPWYRTVPEPTVWVDLLLRGTGQPWHGALAARQADLDQLCDLVRAVPEPTGPFVVGHRDLHPENVLVTAGGELVAVDWADIGPMLPDRELVKVLVQWHVDGAEVDAPAVRRTVTAYRAAGGSGEVRGLDSFTMLLSGELSFLARQAGATLDPRTEAGHREHAVAEVQECLLWLPPPGTLEHVLEIVLDLMAAG
jgi:aminoglycoside phosphotransferase (APT) family kinase protein